MRSLDKWRPRTGGCRALLTTRRATWSRSRGVHPHKPETLDRAESIKLLRRLAPDVAADDGVLDAIVQELGDLPLALHLAGSFLQRYSSSTAARPEAYLADLKEQKIAHASLVGHGTRHSPTEHELDVAATFELSYRRLEEEGDSNRWARALAICQAALGDDHPTTQTIARNLAHLRERMQREQDERGSTSAEAEG